MQEVYVQSFGSNHKDEVEKETGQDQNADHQDEVVAWSEVWEVQNALWQEIDNCGFGGHKSELIDGVRSQTKPALAEC